MRSKHKKIALVMVVVLLAVGLVTGVALAATTSGSAAPRSSSTTVGCGSGCPIAGNQASVQAACAKALGMSVQDLQKELASGKTCAQIAQSKGISTTQLAQITAKARSDLLDKAVANGTMTKEQAQFMKSRMAQCAGAGCSGGPTGSCSQGGCGACGSQ